MIQYCLSALPEIDAALAAARRVLIASDFDGCLCPIANSPCGARVTPAMLEILRSIAACPRIRLAVISGRALADVCSRLSVDAVFAGNHGLEIGGCGLRFDHPGAREFRPEMAGACGLLQTVAREWPGAWVEDKGLSATLHYRGVEPRDHRPLLLAARRQLGRFGPRLALRVGKKALEVRPRVAWEKGSALRHIHSKLGPFDITICIGDDRTDETMFGENQVNIRVGSARPPTKAGYYLWDPAEVAIFLSHVLDLCAWRAPAGAAATVPVSSCL